MNEKFVKLLRELNLTNTQIKIYLSVLKNGLSSVYEISKDIKVNRSQIYLDTNILVEVGLLEMGSKRIKKYLAIDPKSISKIIKVKKNKLEELESLLGDVSLNFERQKKSKLGEYDLKIFEGKSKVKDAFMFELEDSKGKDLISIVGDVQYQYDFFSEEFWDKYNKKFSDFGGKARMLVDKQDKNYRKLRDNYLKHSVETRGLENFNLKSGVDVWGDHALLVSISKTPVAVLLKNKLVAVFYRQIFDKLWKQAD